MTDMLNSLRIFSHALAQVFLKSLPFWWCSVAACCHDYVRASSHATSSAASSPQKDTYTGFAGVFHLVSILFFSVFLVLSCSNPLSAEGAENTEKQVEYREQLRSYQRLKREFDRHPVTRWKGEITRNKKAIAMLDKQLRDMIRFENEEQIEQLRQENRKLRKKINTKKKEWEALGDRLEAARKRLESLEKQIGPAARKE